MTMKIAQPNLVVAALVGALALSTGALAQSTRWDELKTPFKDNFQTPEALARLCDEMQFQRACVLAIWKSAATQRPSSPRRIQT